jgi:hypothetical protein
MTQLDTSALKALRDKKPKKAWRPLKLSTLAEGLYLGADPSLTAFGLVLFEVLPEQRYAVHMAEQFTTSEVETGWEDTLQRAELLQTDLARWFWKWLTTGWGRVYAVHEAPPVGGGKIFRPEASLISGYAFRAALISVFGDKGTLGQLQPVRMLPMVRRQDHARLICGDPNADKKTHHEALKDLFDGIRGADELITNGAKRDALSVALCAAHRRGI